MDPTYPLVPIANFLASILVVVPLFHMITRSWNTGVYVFALWLFLQNINFASGTIAWSSDANDRSPIWCDICKSSFIARAAVLLGKLKKLNKASHLQVLADSGIPACSFVITRRLYKITRLQGVTISRKQVNLLTRCPSWNWAYWNSQRRIELLLELAICVGIPICVTSLCG